MSAPKLTAWLSVNTNFLTPSSPSQVHLLELWPWDSHCRMTSSLANILSLAPDHSSLSGTPSSNLFQVLGIQPTTCASEACALPTKHVSSPCVLFYPIIIKFISKQAASNSLCSPGSPWTQRLYHFNLLKSWDYSPEPPNPTSSLFLYLTSLGPRWWILWQSEQGGGIYFG